MTFRIAYFTLIHIPIRSGPGRFNEQLGQYASDKIKLTCFTDNPEEAPFKEVIKVKKIPVLQKLPGYWLLRSFLFYRSFKSKHNQFDLILCSNAFEALFLALFVKNIPVVVMINDDNYIHTHQHFFSAFKHYPIRKVLARYVGYYIEKEVVKRSDKVIACSSFLGHSIQKNYSVDATKVKTVYPAVDLEFFMPKTRNYFLGPVIQILFVKNDWRRGGLDTIIAGLGKYKGEKKISLSIVGPSEKDRTTIMKLAIKYNFPGEINFEGILDKKELLAKFYNADLFVLASRQEAFGISILEALATSTPVIASETGGIPEILKNEESGFLFSPDSPEAFISVFKGLIENPDQSYPKVNRGLSTCKEFSKNNLYSRLEEFLISFSRE